MYGGRQPSGLVVSVKLAWFLKRALHPSSVGKHEARARGGRGHGQWVVPCRRIKINGNSPCEWRTMQRDATRTSPDVAVFAWNQRHGNERTLKAESSSRKGILVRYSVPVVVSSIFLLSFFFFFFSRHHDKIRGFDRKKTNERRKRRNRRPLPALPPDSNR